MGDEATSLAAWLLHVGFWLAATQFANRVHVPMPRVIKAGRFVSIGNQQPLGCMMALFCVAGAAIGVHQPLVIYDAFLQDPFSGLR